MGFLPALLPTLVSLCSRGRQRVITSSLACCCLAGGVQAFDDELQPLGPEVVVNENLSFTQRWGKVAMDPDGTRFAVAWSTVVFHDISLRFFEGDGTPSSSELLANEVFQANDQDEPMVAMDGAGNLFVCWTDRDGSDGDGIGTFGRVYDAAGQPLGPDFQINQTWMESQWEPMPKALPGGGWVVAFNGDNDGEAYLRFMTVDGTPTTGDVNINTFHNNGQTEAECAVSADGVVLTIYSDFGGNVAPGTFTNLLARRFNTNGLALDPLEFVVNDSTLPFDQLEPRMAASKLPSGQGVFIIVWEDRGNDGDGDSVWARRYNTAGQALGPEWQVNVTTSGDQKLPEVAADHVGNFVVAWEDWSTGSARIVARCYDAAGQSLGGEFVVSGSLVGNYERPQVAMDSSGESVLIVYSGPGSTGSPTPPQDKDIYLRRFSRPALTLLNAPDVGSTFFLDLNLPGSAGDVFAVGASLGSSGIALPDGRTWGLDVDPLFDHALQFPNSGLPFMGFQGVVPPSGKTTVAVVVPPNAILIGLPIQFAGLTLDAAQPGLLNQLRVVTRTLTVTLQ
ncbi:MAG: hypothetical protein ACI9EF_001876 [Pseudohongiellaceae bacterium]|jgi:hypothetical protein